MKAVHMTMENMVRGFRTVEAIRMTDGVSSRRFAERTVIFEPDDEGIRSLYIASGWAMTYKVLPGGTRVVTDFLLRGDVISKTAAQLAQETISALTDVDCIEWPDVLSDESELDVGLSRRLRLEMLKRQARMSERLANIGRRDGLERTGHLLLELAVRMRDFGKPKFDGFICPLRQADIGDAVGLSTVHVNRVLKDMRLKGLVWFRNGLVEFPDRQRLIELVGFEDDYLLPDATSGHMSGGSRPNA